jgi:hypothetical protein
MYLVLLLAVLSLMLLTLQDVLTAVEPESGELHHLFVFDLAWPVFLIAGLATVIAGVAALVIGRLRSDAQLTRYGVWAVAFLVAVLVTVVTESPQPRRLNTPDPVPGVHRRTLASGVGTMAGRDPWASVQQPVPVARYRSADTAGHHRLPRDPDQVAPGPIHLADMGFIDTVSQQP